MDAVRALGTSIPVIFVVVSNPVGAGYVPNLSRPGGNVTGFSTFEPEIAGKWLQLLTQIVPELKNVSMLLDPKFIGFNSLWRGHRGDCPDPRHHASRGIRQQSSRRSSAALDAMTRQDAPGLGRRPSPVNTVNRKRLITIAIEKRYRPSTRSASMCRKAR